MLLERVMLIMKIKKGFAKRNIAGSEIVVPVGKTASSFNGMITLNETGSFFWDCLSQETTKQEVVDKVLEIYEVGREKAEADFDRFTAMLKENGLLEE